MKELSKKLDPFTLNAPRSLVAGLFALVFTLATGRAQTYQALTWDKLAFLLASIWIGGGIGDTAYITSMARIGVSRAFPIGSTYPVLTLVFSILFLSETATWSLGLGVVLVLGGILLLGRTSDESALPAPRAANRSGILLALLASVCWAISSILVAPGVKGLDSIMVSSIRVPAMSLLAWGVVAMRKSWPKLRQLSRREWLYIVVGGLIGWGLGSILFVYTVASIGAARSAVLTSTSPLLALPLCALLLKEKLTRYTLAGAVLAVAGVALVSR
jgi:uncharacterized membrane protein